MQHGNNRDCHHVCLQGNCVILISLDSSFRCYLWIVCHCGYFCLHVWLWWFAYLIYFISKYSLFYKNLNNFLGKTNWSSCGRRPPGGGSAAMPYLLAHNYNSYPYTDSQIFLGMSLSWWLSLILLPIIQECTFSLYFWHDFVAGSLLLYEIWSVCFV